MLGRSLRIGPVEIGLILVLVIILFGVGKLPKIGKSLGEGIKNFRKASTAQDEEAEAEVKDTKEIEASEVKAEKPEDTTETKDSTESA
jgi:sec-independent protein translocase protein TatA